MLELNFKFITDESGQAALDWFITIIGIAAMGFVFLMFREVFDALEDVAVDFGVAQAQIDFANLMLRVGFPLLVIFSAGLWLAIRRGARRRLPVG